MKRDAKMEEPMIPVTMYMPSPMWEAMRTIAKEDDRSTSWLVRKWINMQLNSKQYAKYVT